MLADQAILRCLKGDMKYETVLDIGCGRGEASEIFRRAGRTVISIDAEPIYERATRYNYGQEPHHFLGNLQEHADLIWCSHCLEHQSNPGTFLEFIYNDLKDAGWLAITVPPYKKEIVGGHVTIWNAGLLVYNLVLAGFDCSSAKIKTYDYNCSVIVQKNNESRRKIPYYNLRRGQGDIELLKPWLPDFFHHGVDGNIQEWNW